MLTAAALCLVAMLASGLTFYSGFGLGTLLLPAFALFYPVEVAVASTAVVHFLNGLFKLALAGRYADRRITLQFGLPAMVAALAGAWLLVRLAGAAPLARYSVLGADAVIEPVSLAIGTLLLALALAELHPRFATFAFRAKHIALGGVVSGFFGGLSGMQGAFRSAFLLRAGLTREAFIGTGIAVAVLIDISRLGVYGAGLRAEWQAIDWPVLAAAVLAAFVGAYVGNRMLNRLTLRTLQKIVGTGIAVVGAALAAGLL